MDWYPHYLGHPGINRTKETIGCENCQRNKCRHKKYGHLPEKEAEAMPWDKICIDLIGPYTIYRKGKKKPLVRKCVMMIGPATGWFEIHQHEGK
jgi:hypothetical protein